jgi:hypothetical protein
LAKNILLKFWHEEIAGANGNGHGHAPEAPPIRGAGVASAFAK